MLYFFPFLFYYDDNSSSDGQLIGAIASEVVDWGIISSSVSKEFTASIYGIQLVFTASIFDAQHLRNCTGNDGDGNV